MVISFRQPHGYIAAAALLGTVAVTTSLLMPQAVAQSKFLPADHVIFKSARDVDPKAQTAVVKLHKGNFEGKTVWYILTDASDFGIARDLDVLYAPKLANMAIECPVCVQTVTLGKTAGKFN